MNKVTISTLNDLSQGEVRLTGRHKHDGSLDPAKTNNVKDNHDVSVVVAWLRVSVNSYVFNEAFNHFFLVEIIVRVLMIFSNET